MNKTTVLDRVRKALPQEQLYLNRALPYCSVIKWVEANGDLSCPNPQPFLLNPSSIDDLPIESLLALEWLLSVDMKN